MNTKYINPKVNIKKDEKLRLSEYWQERAIFPGMVPREVKTLVKNSPNIDKGFFRKLIKLSLGYIQGTLSDEECEIGFSNLCKIRKCENESDVLDLSVEYAGVIALLRAALKINLKTVREETLLQDLKELGLAEEHASDVCKVVFGQAYKEVMNQILANNPQISKLESFDWSVDVTLSNSWSSKVLEPAVNMTFKTSDGQMYDFEVPIAAFHQLRHSTASILRQMEALERRN